MFIFRSGRMTTYQRVCAPRAKRSWSSAASSLNKFTIPPLNSSPYSGYWNVFCEQAQLSLRMRQLVKTETKTATIISNKTTKLKISTLEFKRLFPYYDFFFLLLLAKKGLHPRERLYKTQTGSQRSLPSKKKKRTTINNQLTNNIELS